MIKYFAEKGIKPNVKSKVFNSLEELKNSDFDYDYYHKINILKTQRSNRYNKELKAKRG